MTTARGRITEFETLPVIEGQPTISGLEEKRPLGLFYYRLAKPA